MTNQETEYGVTQAAEPEESTRASELRGAPAIPYEAPSEAQYAARTPIVEEAQATSPGPSAEAYAALRAERDQLLDRLARLQAEFDNARKRQERERQEFKDYATGSVVEQFLPVVDNFALALNANASAEQLRTGVELIVKQMEETLRQLQVVPIPTVGQPFDPRVHEALGSVERDDLPDHSVAEEIRKGYRIRERLLRPAMVRIATNSKQTEA